MEVIKPLSRGQEEFVEALKSKEYEVVGVFGPTGSGKSLLSIYYGLEMLNAGIYKRFIISRPVIDVVTGREITIFEGGQLYYEIALSYLRDLLEGIVSWETVENMIRGGKIVFADSHYLRGRTFDNSIILIDDAQALPPHSGIEILMRIGKNSKTIVAGDPVFQKPIGMGLDGASLIREILLGEERAKVVDLGIKDVIRPGARRGIKLLLEARMRSRKLNDVESRILDLARVHAPDSDIITVVEFSEEKKRWEVVSEHAPDALIIVKEGTLGRLLGRGGERIQKIEEDSELRIRAIELNLDFKEVVRAVHPVPWVYKHVAEADFKGPNLVFKVKRTEFGPFVGQRGFYVKFLDSIFKKLMEIGVKAEEYEEPAKVTRRRSRRT